MIGLITGILAHYFLILQFKVDNRFFYLFAIRKKYTHGLNVHYTHYKLRNNLL